MAAILIISRYFRISKDSSIPLLFRNPGINTPVFGILKTRSLHYPGCGNRPGPGVYLLLVHSMTTYPGPPSKGHLVILQWEINTAGQ